MPEKMANIKEILAVNLKENRRKKGWTQEKLAELADMSLHYLAVIELGNNFPSGEMLEKLANALDIQAFELFYPASAPEGTMHHLERSIIANIGEAIDTAVKQSISKETLSSKEYSQNVDLEHQLEAILGKINKSINKAIKNSFEVYGQSFVDRMEQTVSKVIKETLGK